MDSLKVRISLIKPGIIITAAPDGDTHHSEHIVVSAVITELLLAEGWVEKYPLYYFTWKKEIVSVDEGSHMNDQYFNVKVGFTEEDEATNKLKKISNTIYFRKFVVMRGLKNDF